MWLIYALGGGWGHLTRAIALARIAGRDRPVRILTNSPYAPTTDLDIVTLETRAEVVHAIAACQAACLIVDTFPRGIGGELAAVLPTLDALKVLVHRDLTPRYVEKMRLREFVAAHFDLILVPGAGEGSQLGDLPMAVETDAWLVRSADELQPGEANGVLVCAGGNWDELAWYGEVAQALRRLDPNVPVRVSCRGVSAALSAGVLDTLLAGDGSVWERGGGNRRGGLQHGARMPGVGSAAGGAGMAADLRPAGRARRNRRILGPVTLVVEPAGGRAPGAGANAKGSAARAQVPQWRGGSRSPYLRYTTLSCPSPQTGLTAAAPPAPRRPLSVSSKPPDNPPFLNPAKKPCLSSAGNFVLEMHGSRLTLQAWDRTRNLVRRIAGIKSETRGRMELIVERFARREGSLFLIDLAQPAGAEVGRRGPRRVFRERFREMLSRQFPGWKIAELSVEADLAHSLSPAYPRAYLKHGQSGWAAIAASPDAASAAGVLSFGLIWLDYLRRREKRVAIQGLALFVPCGFEQPTCLRLLFLNAETAGCRVFGYSEQGFALPLDPRDFGNLETHLDPCRRADRPAAHPDDTDDADEVERIPRPDGSVSMRVRGIEFARVPAGETASVPIFDPTDLARFRTPDAADRNHPLYRQQPEAWLESQVRANIQQVHAALRPDPVYNQVPAFAGGDRGVMDLVAVDYAGRLAVLELKATADLHLPFQALDYWMRVKWHLDREEFSPLGYFPG